VIRAKIQREPDGRQSPACPDRRRGTAAVEFAVVLVLLMPLLVGLWEVGRLVEVQQILANAAREGGRAAAAGKKTPAQIQTDVVAHLADSGIMVNKGGTWKTVTASDVTITVTNLTNSSRPDPSTANQLDHFQVQVTIPFNSVRWVLLSQLTNVTTMSATADWYSMKDVPITINQNIPLQ
jgi:Flp pilus assembly protein TadG